jgi:hypothetical protein
MVNDKIWDCVSWWVGLHHREGKIMDGFSKGGDAQPIHCLFYKYLWQIVFVRLMKYKSKFYVMLVSINYIFQQFILFLIYFNKLYFPI